MGLNEEDHPSYRQGFIEGSFHGAIAILRAAADKIPNSYRQGESPSTWLVELSNDLEKHEHPARQERE